MNLVCVSEVKRPHKHLADEFKPWRRLNIRQHTKQVVTNIRFIKPISSLGSLIIFSPYISLKAVLKTSLCFSRCLLRRTDEAHYAHIGAPQRLCLSFQISSLSQ